MSFEAVEFLLAEDNEDDALLVEESFREAKLANPLRVVPDGVEALRYLRGEGPYKGAATPGLVLLDLNMPRKGGFEVLEAMKQDPSLRHIPVVVLTTSGREEDVLRSYRAGACSYVRKPVDFDHFRDVIRQFSLYWTLVSVIPNGSE